MPELFSQSVALLVKARHQLVFVSVAVLNHRLRSRQRGSKFRKTSSDYSTLQRFLSKERDSFLSEPLEKVLRLFLAKPFGFNEWRSSNCNPPAAALKRSVTASPPILSLVTKPLSLATCGVYTLRPKASQEESTLSFRIFESEGLWKNLWKTF
ncbi:MAG TPA: hypothetical protein VGB17_13015 [Pyrinomonadaceae bacterium]|jgi:hypothetical protein